MKKSKTLIVTAAALATSLITSQAAPADPADQIAIVSTAFDAAALIAVSMLGFSLVMRVVRKFTKG